jgi:hypothetical protein
MNLSMTTKLQSSLTLCEVALLLFLCLGQKEELGLVAGGALPLELHNFSERNCASVI